MQLPLVGVTVYVAVCAILVGFVSVPFTLDCKLAVAPPVNPPVTTGNEDHAYVVPDGTMSVPLLGVTVKPEPLHVLVVAFAIAAFGFTVNVNVLPVPVQVTVLYVYVGVTVTVDKIDALVVFVDVNALIFPVPLEPKPILVLLLLQLYTVDGTVPLNVIVENCCPTQTVWFEIVFTVGIGLTVTVNELVLTEHAFPFSVLIATLL